MTATAVLTLRQLAEQAAKESETSQRQREREREEGEDRRAARALLAELKSCRIPVSATAADVLFDDPTPNGPYRGAYLVAGEGEDLIVFGVVNYHGDLELALARQCVRCGKDVFVRVQNLAHLHELLTKTDHDHGNCLVQYDADGDPTTDRDGNPLPARGPFSEPAKKEPTLSERLLDTIREAVRDELANQGVGA